MTAIGFGANVTGGGDSPLTFKVTNGGDAGDGSLAKAVSDANAASDPTDPAQSHRATRIKIEDGIRVSARADHAPLTITARDLTIVGGNDSKIKSNQLYFDCSKADNVIIKNLKFEGSPADETEPRDAIKIDATLGRRATVKGFWIDHCEFEAYFDLNITSNAADLANAGPLLMTISNCRFHNDDPGGNNRKNNGAIGVAGSKIKSTVPNTPPVRNQNTNAYATVCNNVFETVRRRSPRASGFSVIHAFNNVLLKWGAANTHEQINGMEAGHNGRLVAVANFFLAGPVKKAITVATGDNGGRVTVPAATDPLANVYENDATPAGTIGDDIDIDQEYRDAGFAGAPTPAAMTDAMRRTIKDNAGPRTPATTGNGGT